MRAWSSVTLFMCCVVVSSLSTAALTRAPESPASRALRYFEALPTRDAGTVLRTLRPPSVSADERAMALAVLPATGALRPDRVERSKLALLETVLAYHDRAQVFTIKVIDVPQAVVALYRRAVLLISRPALGLLTGDELQAIVAHEIGHDFFSAEFERIVGQGDRRGRHELELRCDGIAVLTLVVLRLDPARLAHGLRKLTRFNEWLGADANAGDYPELKERQRFIGVMRDFARLQIQATRAF